MADGRELLVDGKDSSNPSSRAQCQQKKRRKFRRQETAAHAGAKLLRFGLSIIHA
jgi:hypothetical protein